MILVALRNETWKLLLFAIIICTYIIPMDFILEIIKQSKCHIKLN